MAFFEGTVKEFNRFLGAYARLKVAFLASRYKKQLGKCEDCGAVTNLEAAHIKGNERRLIIGNILREFTEDELIKIDLNEFENKFTVSHTPIESTIRILCKDCHRRYDKIEGEAEENNEISMSESAVIEKLIYEQMNKSKAVKVAATKITSLLSSNTIFSNINAAKDMWWLEPSNDKFKNKLHIILNNDNTQQLYIFQIPANTISNPASYFIQRNDRFRSNCSDIYIVVSSSKFVDKKGFDFSKYLIETIEY